MLQVLSKSEHLGEKLKQELSTGRLGLGERFYSIPQVSERYAVSPATAYKVVSGLVKDGYLRSHRGKGYFVEKKPTGRKPSSPAAETGLRTLLLVNDFGESSPPAKVLAGIQDACRESRYRFEIISLSDGNFLEIAAREDVAGLILGIDRESTPIAKVTKPKICIGHWADPDDGVISFIADAERAATETVRHLCGLGHQRIAFVLGEASARVTTPFCAQVVAGLRRGFQTYGLEWDEGLLYMDLHRPESQLIEEFISTFRDRQITAAFVPTWSSVLQLVRRLRREGLSVPDDLSVVTYGEDPLTPHIQP
ncbi:MAG: substrate-binding domain-containing protein, partial [Phycisphaerales bacterium]|nr:substrate-binding domain-containing protein [Phycisphaerales bacterium]